MNRLEYTECQAQTVIDSHSSQLMAAKETISQLTAKLENTSKQCEDENRCLKEKVANRNTLTPLPKIKVIPSTTRRALLRNYSVSLHFVVFSSTRTTRHSLNFNLICNEVKQVFKISVSECSISTRLRYQINDCRLK